MSVENEEFNEFQSSIRQAVIYEKNSSFEFVQKPERTLRILNWNIERGYFPDRITKYINEIKPDIACLQELDWGNERTGNIDVLERIARKTNMRGYFGVEFYEIQTPYRTKRLSGGGVHGNAILSKLEPSQLFRVEMPPAFDWNSNDMGNKIIRRETRQGARFALCAKFKVHDKTLLVVSVHLEDKRGGIEGRHHQFTSLVDGLNTQPNDAVILGGDMNTLDNWLTRITGFSNAKRALGNPFYKPESRLWKEKFLPMAGFSDPFMHTDWTVQHSPLYREKLDWLMVKNCRVVNHGLGSFNSSDHKSLWIDIEI